MPPLISFIGDLQQNNDSIVSLVVSCLTAKGYAVALARSTNSDREAIYPNRKLQSAFVTLITPDKTRLELSGTSQSLTLLSHRFLRSADIVIAEGFANDPHIPKISVCGGEKDPVGKHFKRIIAVVTEEEKPDKNSFNLHESDRITEFIEKRFLLSPRPEQTVLIINDKKIALNGFIQDILANTVAGFTDTLKKTEEKKNIELYICRSEPN